MTNQQREFRRLGWRLVTRLWKLHGHLVWLMERVQHGDELDGTAVDCLYDRWYNLSDALDAFRRSSIWRSVDVVDDASTEADET